MANWVSKKRRLKVNSPLLKARGRSLLDWIPPPPVRGVVYALLLFGANVTATGTGLWFADWPLMDEHSTWRSLGLRVTER